MLRPLRDRIVVRPQERIKSAILHVVQSERPTIGTIVRTGPRATGVQPGDTVRFGTSEEYLSYTEILENGEKLLVMQEADVCFVQE